MSILPVGIGSSGVDVGDIGHSLRLRSSASAYLSKTLSTPTKQNRWTWSGWVKLGVLGTFRPLFNRTQDANTFHAVFLGSDNTFVSRFWASGVQHDVRTTAVLRDPSAWYHLVCVYDTDQVTASDRVKLYINGVLQTVTATYPSQYATGLLNSNTLHWQGWEQANLAYVDGYLSRVCFVDGTALTPSSFGYLNTEINEWVSKSQSACKAVVDAGGTNSFMLDFDDSSSLTTLGYDKSSKGNNWTCNNISLTAGTTYDWMKDTPSNNFAVWLPIDTALNGGTLSNANLTLTTANAYLNAGHGSFSVSSGKWYWEVTPTSLTGGLRIGVDLAWSTASTTLPGSSGTTSYGFSENGQKWFNSSASSYGAAYVAGDVLGVILDMDAGTISLAKNGVDQGVAFSGISGAATPWLADGSATAVSTTTLNFGQRPFAYTPPTGFKELCTANLPSVAIPNPKKHFDVVTRTGTGANTSITGKQFQPDFVWAKSRSNATSNELYDSVRGVNKLLVSDSTAAEDSSQTILLTSFNSDGYSLGSSGAYGLNILNHTYVDWLWKAGGTAVTNTAGSITSTVSANTQAGFSIVTYTGTGANATVGHGLGVAPKMVIVKNRNGVTGPGGNWNVYHANANASPATGLVILNGTGAFATAADRWNNTAPTSAVFSLGNNFSVNESGYSHVAYCFAEIPGYSKFGSYTGNGSADGPFVFCGFKPKYVLVKSSTTTDDWRVYDSTRPGYNVIGGTLLADTAAAETTAAEIDFTSNGFKLRVATTPNAAQTYIFAAFADVPFKYANAR